jgi:preprotein translocase subunit SecG
MIMTPAVIIMAIVQLVFALILTIVVLMQHGRSAGLPGVISGGAETFFGKNKGRSIDAILSKSTSFVAIAFVILTVIVNFLISKGA